MKWGRVLVVVFTGVIGLGVGLIVTEPWDGPTRVNAVELNDDDEAWRDDDAFDGDVRDDDSDDDDTGRQRAAAATDDGRDGTREGDTSHGGGTGTGVDAETDDVWDGTRDGDTGGARGTGTADGADVAANATATFDAGGGGGTTAGGDT